MRKTRVWVILTFVLGVVTAPFALVLLTRALVRFREIGKSDPIGYRQLVLLRRMTIGLILVWSLLLAGWVGLEFRGGGEPPEALVLDATLSRMIEECQCPNTILHVAPGDYVPFDSVVMKKLSEGRHLVVDSPVPLRNDFQERPRQTEVVLFRPHFVSEDLAEVNAQLRNGATGSFGATYTVQRRGKGPWKAISRQLWWSS